MKLILNNISHVEIYLSYCNILSLIQCAKITVFNTVANPGGAREPGPPLPRNA